MSNRQLSILGLLAVVFLGLAIAQSRFNSAHQGSAVGAVKLIQGLATGQIGSIELGQGENLVTLKKNSEGFVVANRDNYPAQTQTINELLISCLDIEVIEKVTSNPENHAELEVTEETAGSVVKFFDKDGKLITGVIVGKSTDRGGAHVRLVTSDDVYVAKQTPRLRTAATDYIDKKLTEVVKDNVEKVTVKSAAETYTVMMDGAGKAFLTKIPAGKKQKEAEVDQLATALSSMSFTDVQKESDKTRDFKFETSYLCQLKNSTIYKFDLAQDGDKHYLKCTADFLDKVESVSKDEIATDQAMKAKEKQILAQQAALEFADRHQGWIYEVSSWEAGKLTKKLDDLLEDIEEEKAEPAPASSTVPPIVTEPNSPAVNAAPNAPGNSPKPGNTE
ncbi:MAG: DUF4340 domain-containing protein [Sedimentisphaerales bacterium]|nr:DUF4340 domain-containing protein [Sedimentisphaerales bacterium]